MKDIKRARYHLGWLETYLEEHPDLEPEVQSDLHLHLAELYTRLNSAEYQVRLMRELDAGHYDKDILSELEKTMEDRNGKEPRV